MRNRDFKERVAFGINTHAGSIFTQEEQKKWRVTSQTCRGCFFFQAFNSNGGTRLCNFDSEMQISRPGVYIKGRFFPEYPCNCSVKMPKTVAAKLMKMPLSDREMALMEIRKASGKPLTPVIEMPQEPKILRPAIIQDKLTVTKAKKVPKEAGKKPIWQKKRSELKKGEMKEWTKGVRERAEAGDPEAIAYIEEEKDKKRAYYQQNRERYKENNRKWREKNKEVWNQYNHDYYSRHKEYFAEYHKKAKMEAGRNADSDVDGE